MEKRTHFYVSRKSWPITVMALLLAASAVARIGTVGLKGTDTSVILWSQILLPLAATILFALIAIINGEMQFYKTAIPVWMVCIYFGLAIVQNYQFGTMVNALFWVCLLFLAVLYTQIISGKGKQFWLLVPLLLLPIASILYLNREALLTRELSAYRRIAPDVLMLLGMVFSMFALRAHPEGPYYPTWGDRPDGRKIRTLSPMDQITSYFQVERNTCSNLYEESFEITAIDRYIRQKRREGLTDFGITHVLLAAYVRGVARYPQLNRFISGQKVYSRGEDIQYCMTVKKEMSLDSPDTAIKVHLNPRDTAADVYRKVNAAIDEVKSSQELDSGLDHLIMNLNLVPSVVLKFVVWLLKLLDYFGMVPKALLELSPFHGSLYFTSMGSLGMAPVFHHLYDFGNLPIFGAFGCKRKALELLEDGTIVQRKYIDMKFTLDERIADGYCYATFFKYFRRLLKNPEVLDKAPDVVVRDIL